MWRLSGDELEACGDHREVAECTNTGLGSENLGLFLLPYLSGRAQVGLLVWMPNLMMVGPTGG